LAAHTVESLGEAAFLEKRLLEAGKLPVEEVAAQVQE
jgi:hypothetical protein